MHENEPHNHEPGEPERKERADSLQPRVWVGSLADYNNGILHGEWLDAHQDAEALQADIAVMLARSPTPGAEEWAIFDYDEFGELSLGEYEDLSVVTRLAAGLVEHGPAFAPWAEAVDHEPDRLDLFTEAFLGHHDSIEDYAAQLLEDLGYPPELEQILPEFMRPYVQLDVAGFARALVASGDVVWVPATGGGVWVYDGTV